MSYSAIFTTLGLTRLAEAIATSTPLVFTHVAVGDGGGSPITPSAGMTALVNEVARVTVNATDIDPDTANTVRVEGLIPAGTGGFTIREAGIFNGAGELMAIASYPPIYKPSIGLDGVSVEEYIRILLTYADLSAISISIDPSVIMATRLYVDDAEQAAKDYADAQDLVVTAAYEAADTLIEDRLLVLLFGDGSDGTFTTSGSTAAPAWAGKVGSVYTMTRDAALVDLTLTGASTRLVTNGFRLYVQGTLTVSGGAKITNDGVAGGSPGTVPGTSAPAGTVGGGSAPGAGGGVGAPGSNSTAATVSLGGRGGNGGVGGGGGGAAGTSGTVTAPAATAGSTKVYSAPMFGQLAGAGALSMITGGSGGAGGGGGAGTGGGGAGGGAGGVIAIAAQHIILDSAGDIHANGANGNDAVAATNGASGGGGGGGFLWLVYLTKALSGGGSPTFSGATNCAKGLHGAKDGTGTDGADGADGTVVEIQV